MGLDFETADAMTGAVYMGANSSWEVIYTLVAVVLCVYALWSGNRHEHKQYEKMKK